MNDQKNLVLAIVLSGIILLGWNFLYTAPREQARQAEIAAQPPAPAEESPTAELGVDGPTAAPQADSAATAGISREEALTAGPRVTIESGRLRGSIALTGARIDDVVLANYRESIEPDARNIELLEPTGTEKPYYAEFGWLGEGVAVPDRDTVWRASGKRLVPGSPVTLSWDNRQGLVFEQTFSLDDTYLFTVTQRVRNTGSAPVTLNAYGLLSRTGTPPTLGYYILHEGLLGVLDGTLVEEKYGDLTEGEPVRQESTGGWLGITDKYWLVALVPPQGQAVKTSFSKGSRGGMEKYQADFLTGAAEIPAGGTAEVTNRLFTGAKEVALLDKYEKEAGIPRFDLAVDFGWFYFLTKPIFYVLDYLNRALGNFGLAILALTVLIKVLMFPLANKSYRSMSRMKLLSPKIAELRERYPDDRLRQNQEMMELYKREKVNPAAGCLPMLVQIPVFFALYKVLFVTIEMRHAPFYGWIHDLSAPDPLGMLTVFGLVQWDIPASLLILNIGIWPILMGITMFAQQKMNPPPPDPTQAKIMMYLPLIFTFMLGSFPAGLVIYWTWNNLLSIGQQWVIMKGVERGARHG